MLPAIAIAIAAAAVLGLGAGCGSGTEWTSPDDPEVKAAVSVRREHAFEGYYSAVPQLGDVSLYVCGAESCDLQTLAYDEEDATEAPHPLVEGALCTEDQCIHLSCYFPNVCIGLDGIARENFVDARCAECGTVDAFLADGRFFSPSLEKAEDLRASEADASFSVTFLEP